MKKQADPNFRTHIKEPRWQQILSVGIVLVGVLVWVSIIIFSN